MILLRNLITTVRKLKDARAWPSRRRARQGHIVDEWHCAIADALRELSEAYISEVLVAETALYEQHEVAYFSDPCLRFVQASVLELRLASGRLIQFLCSQDEDSWTIEVRTPPEGWELRPRFEDGIFRTRYMGEFPLGKVEHLNVDDSSCQNIQEITLSVNGQLVILRAGEVYENIDNTLTVVDHDESVLVFLEERAYSELTFNKPFYRPTLP